MSNKAKSWDRGYGWYGATGDTILQIRPQPSGKDLGLNPYAQYLPSPPASVPSQYPEKGTVNGKYGWGQGTWYLHANDSLSAPASDDQPIVNLIEAPVQMPSDTQDPDTMPQLPDLPEGGLQAGPVKETISSDEKIRRRNLMYAGLGLAAVVALLVVRKIVKK